MEAAISKIPQHVAIIMDGNGRWAKEHSIPRLRGHLRGMRIIRSIVKESSRLGIKYLTLYSFSEENWNRPAPEVNFLMRLLRVYLLKEREELHRNNVRILSIGNLKRLPAEPLAVLNESIEYTKNNTGLNLVLALSYSGRLEIIDGVRQLCQEYKKGLIKDVDINIDRFNNYLYTSFMPDPDLLIRTSGEFRISNFLLWQLAYSELYVTDIYWPEFTVEEYHKALNSFAGRERRFGKV